MSIMVGYNCCVPMPFQKHAKLTIENQHSGELKSFFFQVGCTLYDEIPENTAYFHAQYRRQRITQLKQDYAILDREQGSSQYVGTYMAHTALERYWYREGELKSFLD